MKGKLNKINGRWFVNYSVVKYKGGIPKQLGSYTKMVEPKILELIPNDQDYLESLHQPNIGTRVEFTEVLVNPMGREVDPNDLGQNHSGCVWYAKLVEDKEEQKQHLIDMIKGDEELDMYNENSPVYNHQARLVNDLVKELKFEEVFNEEKTKMVKEFISNYPKALTIDELIDRYIEETGYGMDMWSKEETNTFTTIKKILYDRG
jgi:hypothetical protein